MAIKVCNVGSIPRVLLSSNNKRTRTRDQPPVSRRETASCRRYRYAKYNIEHPRYVAQRQPAKPRHKSIVAAAQRIQTRQIRMRVHTRRQSPRQNRILILVCRFRYFEIAQTQAIDSLPPNKQTGNQHPPVNNHLFFRILNPFRNHHATADR